MDVAAWLRGLGLEQYAQLFRDNDIDGEILCGMTTDLKELGISSFGHCRRLLNAITILGGEPPTRDAAQSATSERYLCSHLTSANRYGNPYVRGPIHAASALGIHSAIK